MRNKILTGVRLGQQLVLAFSGLTSVTDLEFLVRLQAWLGSNLEAFPPQTVRDWGLASWAEVDLDQLPIDRSADASRELTVLPMLKLSTHDSVAMYVRTAFEERTIASSEVWCPRCDSGELFVMLDERGAPTLVCHRCTWAQDEAGNQAPRGPRTMPTADALARLGYALPGRSLLEFVVEGNLSALKRELQHADYRVFEVEGSRMRGGPSIFQTIRASLPLDPPLVGSDRWDALSDSLFAGVAKLGAERIAILWTNIQVPCKVAPKEFQQALMMFAKLKRQLNRAEVTAGCPASVRIVLMSWQPR